MVSPRIFLTENDRVAAVRTNEHRYKKNKYLFEQCDLPVLLGIVGNRAKHFRTEKHKLNWNLRDVIFQNNLLRNVSLEKKNKSNTKLQICSKAQVLTRTLQIWKRLS